MEVTHSDGDGDWISTSARFYLDGDCILTVVDCSGFYSKGETISFKMKVFVIEDVLHYPLTNDVDYNLKEYKHTTSQCHKFLLW